MTAYLSLGKFLDKRGGGGEKKKVMRRDAENTGDG